MDFYEVLDQVVAPCRATPCCAPPVPRASGKAKMPCEILILSSTGPMPSATDRTLG